MVQSNPALHEAVAVMRRTGWLDADRCPSAYAPGVSSRTSTSSAMLSTDGGTTTPSILAVCWLMTSSNFCGTGGLPVGLSPLILGAAGGSRLRLLEGRHRCRSLSGRLDLRFGELAAKVCR